MTIVALLLIGAMVVPFNTLAQTSNKTNFEQCGRREEIKNFNNFLQQCLGKQVLEYTTKPLTKPGDNYNSQLHAIEVKLMKNDHSDEVEILQLVGKSTLRGPIGVTQSKQIFKEIHFYSDIIPAIEQFERMANIPESERIDAFTRYFGSRMSLDHDVTNIDAIDSDALLLIENLKSTNFVSPNRWIGFDRAETFAILKKLAKMHALVIAMRRVQPNMFDSKVVPYVNIIFNDSFVEIMIETVDKFVANPPANFPTLSPEVQIAIENALNHSKDELRRTDRILDSPYTTIHHRDLWSKNIMLKKDPKNGIQVKLLDFQAYVYGTFVFDLIHLLLFNGPVDDMRVNFKSYIEHYHAEFEKTLRFSNCPLDDYTFDKIWNEIKDKAKLSLLKLYLYISYDHTVPQHAPTDKVDSKIPFFKQPAAEAVLNRWKCANDLYLENGFF